MALSKDQALEATYNILTGPRSIEMERLDKIAEAVRPCAVGDAFQPTVQIPADAPPLMKELARKSDTNYLPLLVKTFGQVMKGDGYYTETDEGGTDPWQWWQRNRMDSHQTGLHRAALQYGTSYATVLPGTYGRGEPGPAIKCYSPRLLTALYQDLNDEWPMMAVGVDSTTVTLIDEEAIYRFGIETSPLYGPLPAAAVTYGTGRLTYITTENHDIGVCPVVRYRDRNLLIGEESLGIVEPLLTINDRIQETTFQMMVTQYFQAFKQRYVLGWVPKDEEERVKAGAARIFYLDEDPNDVKIDQLDGSSIEPYIASRNSSIRDFAAIGQIPAQALGIDGISNISDATLAGLESAKNREAGEITTSLGESHEQMLRLCAFIDGNQKAADDYSSELRWRDFEARSYAQTIDGLGKLVTMLGLDPAIALEDVPGMTEQKLQRAQASIRRQQGTALVEMLNKQPAGPGAVDATA